MYYLYILMYTESVIVNILFISILHIVHSTQFIHYIV